MVQNDMDNIGIFKLIIITGFALFFSGVVAYAIAFVTYNELILYTYGGVYEGKVLDNYYKNVVEYKRKNVILVEKGYTTKDEYKIYVKSIDKKLYVKDPTFDIKVGDKVDVLFAKELPYYYHVKPYGNLRSGVNGFFDMIKTHWALTIFLVLIALPLSIFGIIISINQLISIYKYKFLERPLKVFFK